MTPPRLRALAAAHALADALLALEARAVLEARARADLATAAADPLRSPIWGSRAGAGSGYSDPTGGAVLALGAWAPGTPEPLAALLGDVMRQLDAAAGHLPGAPGMDPLDRIRQAIPGMRDHIAARTRQALAHLDGIVRRRLRMPAARQPMVGVECPDCRTRALHLTDAGPEPERMVVCGGCDGCWPRDAVISVAPKLGATSSKLGASR